MPDDDDKETFADKSWVGREAMVTYAATEVPEYHGIVTRVTEDGDFVEVERRVLALLFYRQVRQWRRAEDVYPVLK